MPADRSGDDGVAELRLGIGQPGGGAGLTLRFGWLIDRGRIVFGSFDERLSRLPVELGPGFGLLHVTLHQ
jgi:hypothetical protein